MDELKSELCPYTGKKCTMEKCHAYRWIDGHAEYLADKVKWGEPHKTLGDVLIYHIYKTVETRYYGCPSIHKRLNVETTTIENNEWKNIYERMGTSLYDIVPNPDLVIPPRPIRENGEREKEPWWRFW